MKTFIYFLRVSLPVILLAVMLTSCGESNKERAYIS